MVDRVTDDFAAFAPLADVIKMITFSFRSSSARSLINAMVCLMGTARIIALERGMVDRVTDDFAAFAPLADVIILAVPIKQTIAFIKNLILQILFCSCHNLSLGRSSIRDDNIFLQVQLR